MKRWAEVIFVWYYMPTIQRFCPWTASGSPGFEQSLPVKGNESKFEALADVDVAWMFFVKGWLYSEVDPLKLFCLSGRRRHVFKTLNQPSSRHGLGHTQGLGEFAKFRIKLSCHRQPNVFFWMHFHREGSGRLPSSSPSRSAKPLRRHLWGNYSARRLAYIPRSLRVAFAKSWSSG